MKLLVASATVVLLYSGVAMAQTQGDKLATAQPPEVTLVTGNENKHAREADARHCLALKNNLEIMRCAEKYRYRGGAKASGT